MGSSTPRTRRERNSTPQPNSTEQGRSNAPKRLLTAKKGPGVRISFPPAESQVRTCLSREFALLRREAAVFRGCAAGSLD
jgi:hypothetical protein